MVGNTEIVLRACFKARRENVFSVFESNYTDLLKLLTFFLLSAKQGSCKYPFRVLLDPSRNQTLEDCWKKTELSSEHGQFFTIIRLDRFRFIMWHDNVKLVVLW